MQQMNRPPRPLPNLAKRLDEVNLRLGIRSIDKKVYDSDIQFDHVIANLGAIASVEGKRFSTVLLHRFGLRLSADEGVQVAICWKLFLDDCEAREKGTT